MIMAVIIMAVVIFRNLAAVAVLLDPDRSIHNGYTVNKTILQTSYMVIRIRRPIYSSPQWRIIFKYECKVQSCECRPFVIYCQVVECLAAHLNCWSICYIISKDTAEKNRHYTWIIISSILIEYIPRTKHTFRALLRFGTSKFTQIIQDEFCEITKNIS